MKYKHKKATTKQQTCCTSFIHHSVEVELKTPCSKNQAFAVVFICDVFHLL